MSWCAHTRTHPCTCTHFIWLSSELEQQLLPAIPTSSSILAFPGQRGERLEWFFCLLFVRCLSKWSFYSFTQRHTHSHRAKQLAVELFYNTCSRFVCLRFNRKHKISMRDYQALLRRSLSLSVPLARTINLGGHIDMNMHVGKLLVSDGGTVLRGGDDRNNPSPYPSTLFHF